LLEGNPAVSEVFAAPAAKAFAWQAALATLRALRARRYDVALDFQGLWKSAAWTRLSGAARVVGWQAASRREPASQLLIGERVARNSDHRRHVIDKNLALLEPLGIAAEGAREFPLPRPREAVARVDAGLAALAVLAGVDPKALVVLNPGGGWASKLWPAERFGELARALRSAGLRPLVSWGPGEQNLADRVVAASGGAAERSFPTTLLDLVELARRARLVVAADTGPLHIACAVGTPVVALFGPTDPQRNGPFAPSDVVVRRTPACAPCYSRSCLRHAGIMSEIGAGEVQDAVARRLATAEQERIARAV
jgi:ADP-heptose:LPS heptosyltransferase